MSRVKSLRFVLSRLKRQHLQRQIVAAQRDRVNQVFIHIPKCGGTSLTQALGQRIKLHDTAVERYNKLGAARWEDVYSFSVVRHPFDRTVSFYTFHSQTAHGAGRLGGLSLNDWVRAVLRDRTIWKSAPTGLWRPATTGFRTQAGTSWLTTSSGSKV